MRRPWLLFAIRNYSSPKGRAPPCWQDMPHSRPAIRVELMERHREAWRISVRAARALRALCWIGHAESEFQALTADAGGPPTVDALRTSVFAQLWREEMVSIR